MFENRVLRRIFGPKGEEVTMEWRKLHNEELNDMYFSSSIFRVIKLRRMRLAGHLARIRQRRGVYRVLVGKLVGKRPLGKLRCRWEDNIKMDLQVMGCGGTDWMNLAQDRDGWRALVNVVMSLLVPQNAGNFLKAKNLQPTDLCYALPSSSSVKRPAVSRSSVLTLYN